MWVSCRTTNENVIVLRSLYFPAMSSWLRVYIQHILTSNHWFIRCSVDLWSSPSTQRSKISKDPHSSKLPNYLNFKMFAWGFRWERLDLSLMQTTDQHSLITLCRLLSSCAQPLKMSQQELKILRRVRWGHSEREQITNRPNMSEFISTGKRLFKYFHKHSISLLLLFCYIIISYWKYIRLDETVLEHWI